MHFSATVTPKVWELNSTLHDYEEHEKLSLSYRLRVKNQRKKRKSLLYTTIKDGHDKDTKSKSKNFSPNDSCPCSLVHPHVVLVLRLTPRSTNKGLLRTRTSTTVSSGTTRVTTGPSSVSWWPSLSFRTPTPQDHFENRRTCVTFQIHVSCIIIITKDSITRPNRTNRPIYLKVSRSHRKHCMLLFFSSISGSQTEKEVTVSRLVYGRYSVPKLRRSPCSPGLFLSSFQNGLQDWGFPVLKEGVTTTLCPSQLGSCFYGNPGVVHSFPRWRRSTSVGSTVPTTVSP